MHAASNITATRLVPLMRYRDVAAAIEWLCETFGFERHLVVANDEGEIAYAQLMCGGGIIMLCPVEGSGLDTIMAQPDEVGGLETQSCYLVVGDADAHYAHAKNAGAQIVLDIKGNDAGRRGYSCRDPEGHIWSFGTYDPWANGIVPAPESDPVSAEEDEAPAPMQMPVLADYSERLSRGIRRPALTASLLFFAALVAWGTYGSAVRTVFDREARNQPTFYNIQTREKPAAAPARIDRRAEEAAKRSARMAEQQLAAVQAEKAAADRALREMQDKLIHVRDEKEKALGVAQQARADTEKAKTAVAKLQKELAEREAELEEAAAEDEASHSASASALKANRTAQAAARRAAARARKARMEARKRRWAAEEKAKLPWPHNMW